ncbi:MAG: hypothetical protein D6725_10290 [Planctomycetota bacterium]|nr:MAG: hypothetical protein D6725_10290 [Planctomycetota bacterium]
MGKDAHVNAALIPGSSHVCRTWSRADRNIGRTLVFAVASLVSHACLMPAEGATFRTANFIVDAATPQIAEQVARAAEYYRRELAEQWFGRAFPNWAAPCRITADTSKAGAGGATTFTFSPGPMGRTEVYNWDMKIQGPLDRLLVSVIPHEVSHTVLASYFRRPLPRWADEGAATLAEDEQEKRRQRALVRSVLANRRLIPLASLLRMTEYPADMQQVLTLYAQGFALCDYLIQWKGRSAFLALLTDAHRSGWESAFARQYGVRNLAKLEAAWLNWVRSGFPDLTQPRGDSLAAARSDGVRPRSAAARTAALGGGVTPVAVHPVVRAQSPGAVSAEKLRRLAEASSVFTRWWYSRRNAARDAQPRDASQGLQHRVSAPLPRHLVRPILHQPVRSGHNS